MIAVSFSQVKNSVTAHYLMCFDTVENESSTLNQVQHKLLGLPHHIAQQIEAPGTVNKLGQVLLQGHTACVRYLHGAINFWTLYVENTGKIILMPLSELGLHCTDFHKTHNYSKALHIDYTCGNMRTKAAMKLPATVNQPAFTDSYTELHNSLRNILVSDIRSQTDEQTWSPHKTLRYMSHYCHIHINHHISYFS